MSDIYKASWIRNYTFRIGTGDTSLAARYPDSTEGIILERETQVLPHVTRTQLKASILVYLICLYHLKVWIRLFCYSILLSLLLFYLKHTKQWTVFIKLCVKCIFIVVFLRIVFNWLPRISSVFPV